MAALPASNTRRLFFITQYGPFLHSTQVRVDNTTPEATLVTNLHFDLDILKSQLVDDCHIVGVEVAALGSDVRNPVASWATISGAIPAGGSAQRFARTFSLRGRTVGGHKVKMLLWGLGAGAQDDFELTPGVGDLASFINLVGTRASMYLGIDGLKPVWYSNLLEDYNDHYEREMRP